MGDVKLVSPYDMVPTLDAIRLVVKHAPSVRKIAVPVDECVGYVCAEDVYAARSIPEVSTAVMDGFALHSSVFDITSAGCPVVLRVLDKVFAGSANTAAQSDTDSALSVYTPTLSASSSLTVYNALCASLSLSPEERGVAVYVSTGAPLPPWCDCVQQVEECVEVGHSAPVVGASNVKDAMLTTTQLPATPSRFTRVAVAKAVSGQFVRPPSIDIPRGAAVLAHGDAITAGDKAVLISVGVCTVSVYAFPRVCVLSTGNEVIPYQRARSGDACATTAETNSEGERQGGSAVPSGMVVDSNGPMLLELIDALAPPAAGKHTFSDYGISETSPLIPSGSPTTSAPALRQGPASLFPCVVRDDPLALCCALLEASLAHGVVVLTGGVSMGDKDHCKYVLQRCGQVLFGRMHMKPGKPATAALFHCRQAAAFLRAHGQDADIDECMYPRTHRYLRALSAAEGAAAAPAEHPSDGRNTAGHFEGLNNEALVIALPGNPVSAFVCAHLLCRPVLLKASGACIRFTRDNPDNSESSEASGLFEEIPWPALLPPRVPAMLLHSLRTDPERPEFHRMRVRYDAAAQVFVCYSTGSQASSRLLNVSQCDGLAYLDHAVVDLDKQPLQCRDCRVGGRVSRAVDELAAWRREVSAELPHGSTAFAAPQCCPVGAFAGSGWLPRGAVVDVLLTRDLHRQPDAFAALSAMELRLVTALEQQARGAGVAKAREAAWATACLAGTPAPSSCSAVTVAPAAAFATVTTHATKAGPAAIASEPLPNKTVPASCSASTSASASPDADADADASGDAALAQLLSRYQFGGKHECRCGSKSDRVVSSAATGPVGEKAKEAIAGGGQVLTAGTQPPAPALSVSGAGVGVVSAAINPHQLPHALDESPDVAATQAAAPADTLAGGPGAAVSVAAHASSVAVDSGIRVGVVTVSTSCADGLNEDKSGPRIADILAAYNAQATAKQSSGSQRPPRFEVAHAAVVRDDAAAIETLLRRLAGQTNATGGGTGGRDGERVDVVFTSGGTGFSPSDVTPECTRRVIDKEAPGISQFMMQTSLSCTPMGALSRAVAGIAGSTLIINLPGSPKAIVEVLPTLLSILPHAVRLMKGT